MNQPDRRRTHTGAEAMTLMEVMIVVSIIALLASLIIGFAGTASKNARRNQAKALLQTVQTIALEYQTLTRRGIDAGWVVNHSVQVNQPIDWESPLPEHLRSETDLHIDANNDGIPDDPRWINLKIGDEAGANDSGETGDLSQEPSMPLPQYLAESSQTPERNHVTIERFVWAIFQLPETRQMLENLGSKFLADTDGDDFIEIIDPWGEPLFYAAYVDHEEQSEVEVIMDDFLVERKTWADKQNPADHRSQWRPVFASAGEDRLWGKVKAESEFPPERDENGMTAYDRYLETVDGEPTIDNLYSDQTE